MNILIMAFFLKLWTHVAICLLYAVGLVNSTSPFLQSRTIPGWEWKMVGYLNMTDPTQRCPDSWQNIASPISSCGRKSNAPCDSLNIPTSGASYQTVCGRFRGYQIGSPDAFQQWNYAIQRHRNILRRWDHSHIRVTWEQASRVYICRWRLRIEYFSWYMSVHRGWRAPASVRVFWLLLWIRHPRTTLIL